MPSSTALFDPGPGEPHLGPFTPRPLADLLPAGRGRRVVLIDGRGGAGKSTLAAALADEATRSGRPAAVVATDDLAWHHSRFGWHDLLVTHIIEPLLAGDAVNYRPPGWVAEGRGGSVQVPAGPRLLIVEGTGALTDAIAPLADFSVWVTGDVEEQRRRGIAREVDAGVRDQDAATRFWDDWQTEERPFLASRCPWDLADLAVLGTVGETRPPAGGVLAADGTRGRPRG
ncbi:hypothetical protein QQA02_07485 [Corynebacterium sp. MSK006]|uniref:uridine kinase family protein n=1 Tax=Corynebacterium sp. MSK006 TaxID=3050187 RepID=UPI00254D7A5D|nr:hypothetical protein [Corynebacterium sp. MSK006]MDK8895528.1 hypothetical protein [Corynebacterium sp. MSK006]